MALAQVSSGDHIRPQPAEMRRSPCAGSVTWHKMALNQLDLENYGSTWVKRLGKPSNGLLYFKKHFKKIQNLIFFVTFDICDPHTSTP